MKSLCEYIKHPRYIGLALLTNSKLSSCLPDKLFLSLRYYFDTGHRLHLSDPKLFGEKIQWLKLYNRKAEYSLMVDKVEAKKYVSHIVGEQYIIPNIAVWDTPDQIDFDKLPDKFVLKTTHGGGSAGVIICKDKSKLNIDEVKQKLSFALKLCLYKSQREWPYKNVPKRILAEKFMEDDQNDDLLDYKFFCFNGEPKLCQVIGNRRTNETIDFYDMDWNHIPGLVGLNPNVSNSPIVHNQPQTFETMKEIACKLSSSIPFARIDLYEINGNCFFGEITFYPNGGLGRFYPQKWNEIIGSWIDLNR